jgi:adenosylmethionine---8-amino-7-oxononanoate aminotransferase
MDNKYIHDRSRKAVWHPSTQMKQHETLPLITISRGEGAWLYGVNGKRYLDAIGSWWVNLFGHGNRRINERSGTSSTNWSMSCWGLHA